MYTFKRHYFLTIKCKTDQISEPTFTAQLTMKIVTCQKVTELDQFKHELGGAYM